MDIITGYTGSPHVTAEQDRDINIGIFGNESYVLQTGSQLTAEVSSNNEGLSNWFILCYKVL